VSSLVACRLFVAPAVEALQGAVDPGPRFDWGRFATEVRRDSRRDTLVRAVATATPDGTMLAPVTGQDSHMIVRASGANALALVRRGDGACEAGSAVEYLRL
jgi:molybdopterin biosynthesis enzyme